MGTVSVLKTDIKGSSLLHFTREKRGELRQAFPYIYKEYVGNNWILRFGVMFLHKTFYRQVGRKSSRISYFNTVIVDSDAYRTTWLMIRAMAK